jgi:hypothetical protein
MEPSVEIFLPSRQYARIGWAALAGSLICVLCGFRAPLAFIPALLCVITASALFWLAARPPIRLGENQFNIGDRAIAWSEVREINRSWFNRVRFISPLILHLKLTNSRYKLLVFPGDALRIARLLEMLRRNSSKSSFDGVPYRDYWAWASVTSERGENPIVEPPVRLFSNEDEEEIERLFQRLKTVGRLDSRPSDAPKTGPKTTGKD